MAVTVSLSDISKAWSDYVDNTISVTVTSTGVPAGESEFNKHEKVKYDLNVTNGTSSTGVQVENVFLHLTLDTTNIVDFIVPPTSTANVYSDSKLTSPLSPPNKVLTGVTEIYLQNSSLKSLAPGAAVPIPGLEVIGEAAGTVELHAHAHASLAFETLFPNNEKGTDGKKSLTVKT
jgi:hypothetical protein